MTERKAFFISDERLTTLDNEKRMLVIFDMSHDMVVGVETINMDDKFITIEELLLFLQKKYIHVIYVSEIDNEMENMLLNSGVSVKTAVTLKDDRLFNSLYFSPPVF